MPDVMLAATIAIGAVAVLLIILDQLGGPRKS